MSIEETIQSRRSYYTSQFSGEEINRRVIEELLESANWAPNHLHTEPWRFVVFSRSSIPPLMDFMAGLYKKNSAPEKFSQAKFEKYEHRKTQISHAIIIAVDHNSEKPVPRIEEVCATAMAVQNMWLRLEDFPGIGGYWSSGDLVYKEEFGEFAGLKTGQQCLGIFYLGVIREDAPKPVGVRGNWKDKVVWR